MGRTSIKEPGKKARMLLINTVKPPLTRPLIKPDKISPLSIASSKATQSWARLAFSRESLVSPKPFSMDSMVTVTKSPTLTSNSPLLFLNSATSIKASDFKPAFTVTKLLSIFNTSAVITSPTVISWVAEYSSRSCAKFSIKNKSLIKRETGNAWGLRLSKNPPTCFEWITRFFRQPEKGYLNDKKNSALYLIF